MRFTTPFLAAAILAVPALASIGSHASHAGSSGILKRRLTGEDETVTLKTRAPLGLPGGMPSSRVPGGLSEEKTQGIKAEKGTDSVGTLINLKLLNDADIDLLSTNEGLRRSTLEAEADVGGPVDRRSNDELSERAPLGSSSLVNVIGLKNLKVNALSKEKKEDRRSLLGRKVGDVKAGEDFEGQMLSKK